MDIEFLTVTTPVPLDAQHPSRAYVDMICKFLRGDSQQARYWRKLRRLAWEFSVQKLAVKQSRELKKQYGLEPGHCYSNAARLVLERPLDFDYVEGIATSIIPTEHAWVVDKTWGWVIDPTWIGFQLHARKPEHRIKDYFGVRIPIELVRAELRERETYGPLLPGCMADLKSPVRSRPMKEPD